MKKTLRNILVILLAVAAVVCSAIGLSACGKAKLEGLRVDNAKIAFRVNDEFEYGGDFAVYALYSDGTEVDVTEEAVRKQEAGFDMSKPGDYQITVSWGGKKEVYTIYVSDFDNILRKIELDTASVKKSYALGENVSFDGLKIKCTYENAQGNYIEQTTTSLKDFIVTIADEDGYEIDEVYDKMGTYTVTVRLGAVYGSFTVTVDTVSIDTVQGAIAVSAAFKDKIISGSQTFDRTLRGNNADIMHEAANDYEFGDNYTYVREKLEQPVNEYHLSIDNSNIFCVQFQGGTMVQNSNIQTQMIDGPLFSLWYSRERTYGAENILNRLYKAAKECTNKDLEETADPEKMEYSFSFSGLVFISSTDDFYQTSVSFSLNEDYSLKHLEYVQYYYEKTADDSSVIPTFVIENGIAKPNDKRGAGYYSAKDIVTVDQIAGERIKTNPYSADALKIKSYDLMYKGENLGDNGVVNCTVSSSGNTNITLNIANLTPSTASFEQDHMYLDYEGNFGGEVDSSTFLYFDDNLAFRDGNVLTVSLKRAGVWTLKIRTSKTYKTVKFNVSSGAPTSMTAQLGNEKTGKFTSGSQKTVAIGGTVYFKGLVNQYADETQTAAVTSGTASNVTIEEATLGGVNCFKFKATAAGTYKVTVSSSSASSVKCVFTFTVSEMPDYASLLNGKYTATDKIGDIYETVFTPDGSAEGVSGTVVVTKTDTENGSKTTETLNYSVDIENMRIELTHVSGQNLGVDFKVGTNNKLMLEDALGNEFTLTVVNE